MSTDAMDTEIPLPPEILKLTGREQRSAAPFYRKWMAIFMADRPNEHDDNRRRALNGAYGTAARYWLGPTALFGVPAAIVLSVGPIAPGIILLVIAVAFFCAFTWRLIQALRFFPHLAMRRSRTTAKHPTLYD